MARERAEPLRVVVYGDEPHRLAAVAGLVREHGHLVTPELHAPGEIPREELEADVGIVALSSGSLETFQLVERIVAEAVWPVVACLGEADDHFIGKIADAGVLTCVVGHDPEAWRSVVETVLRHFAAFHDLNAALRRRAVIERAKGVLMERHGTREGSAFELIRSEARRTNRRVVDVAQAVLDGHPLLPKAQ
jgi:AmiR/NasT family two-component response regulator